MSMTGVRVRHRRWRDDVLPTLTGSVLDLGAGDGPSADHLAADVHWIALEPHPTDELRARVAEREGATLRTERAECLPLDDASVDAVIASAVLCSTRDQAATLAEIRRVLRPGGRLVFFEHVGVTNARWTRFVLRLYRPLSIRFDAGCDPCQDTESALRRAEFTSLTVDHADIPDALGTVVPLIWGEAIR